MRVGTGNERMVFPDLDVIHAQVKADPDLMRFQADVELLETFKRQLTGRLRPDRQAPMKILAAVQDLTDTIRKVKEAEHRRVRDLALVVSAERHIQALRMVGEITFTMLTGQAELLRAKLIAGGCPADVVHALVKASDWTLAIKLAVQQANLKNPSLYIDAPKEPDEPED